MVSMTDEGNHLYREHLEYDRKSLEAMSDLFGGFSDDEVKRLIEAGAFSEKDSVGMKTISMHVA